MKNKKIFLLSNKFYFPHFGGVETTVKHHADFLSKNFRHKINVLVSNEKFQFYTKIFKQNLRLSIVKVEQLGIFFSMPVSISYPIKFIKFAKTSDVIFLHEPWPLGTISLFIFNFFFRQKRQKTIIFWHSDTKKLFFIDQILLYLQKYNIRKSNFVLVNKEEVLKNSKIKNLKDLKNKVYVLPTPIIFLTKNKNISNEILNFVTNIKNNNNEIFLFYGRLAKYKGIEIILKSLSLISNKKVVLIFGKGVLENAVKEEIQNNNNLFFFNRFINDKEKIFVLKNSTAFLFPSISNSETLGLTQIEALSQGCPVINTSIKTAVPYVSINNITGKTILPNNHLELAYAINNFPSINGKEWEKLSHNSKERYNKHFSANIFEKKLSYLVKNVIDGKLGNFK